MLIAHLRFHLHDFSLFPRNEQSTRGVLCSFLLHQEKHPDDIVLSILVTSRQCAGVTLVWELVLLLRSTVMHVVRKLVRSRFL